MDGLTCTCGMDWNSSGMPQEEIERRLAARFGMSTKGVHELLDLLTDTLDKVLDIPHAARGEHETATRMAREAGTSVAWMTAFVEAWESVSGDVHGEGGT